MNKRVTVNSNELLLHDSNGHASVTYNIIGKHLARIRLNTIQRPSVQSIKLCEKARLGVVKITFESTATIEELT